jgi:hypothetical protein
MSDDSSGVDRLRHWQIKDFPEAKRRKVIEAAQLAGKTVTDWLEPVIDRALGGDLPAVNRRVYPGAAAANPADTLATVVAAIGALAAARGVPKATRKAVDATVLLALRDVRQTLGESPDAGESHPHNTLLSSSKN